MRLDIAGHHTAMPPHLLSGIVERLEVLNTAQAPTFRARVTLYRRTQQPRNLHSSLSHS
jgi:hypothetical protein